MSRLRHALIIVFLPLSITMQIQASSLTDYAGQYVLRLGSRNFIVLRLHYEHGKLNGTLSRSRHSSLGTFFTDIGSEVMVEPLVSADVINSQLHFAVKNPFDPTDTDAYDLTLTSASKAFLHFSDIPLDPWELGRLPLLPELTVSSEWDPTHAYYPDESSQTNAEMDQIVDEDQKPRQKLNPSAAEWVIINQRDKEHRDAVRKLIAQSALHNAKDFSHAALIFQHSNTPDDYLLAHSLAMIAVARGDAGALWIATATLDRYLNSIKQPQIYGTQFHSIKETPWTQEPYNRDLISDGLRHDLNVPSMKEQQKQLEQYKTTSPK